MYSGYACITLKQNISTYIVAPTGHPASLDTEKGVVRCIALIGVCCRDVWQVIGCICSFFLLDEILARCLSSSPS
jgi:hypothetical protein